MIFICYTLFVISDFDIIDISLPLNNKTIIYPNNTKVEIKILDNSESSISSSIQIGSHSGSHVDAPFHIFKNGLTIDKIDSKKLVGKARVLDLTSSLNFISKEDLMKKNPKKGERLLLKTKNSERGFDKFYDDFIYLSSEGATFLADLGIFCIGIDYLSIKQKGSKNTTAHTAFLRQNIPIIEGINLLNVSEGDYFLFALPLFFTGIDASPARIILLKE